MARKLITELISSFSKKTTKSTIGLDIGCSSIKVIQLKREGQNFILENYAIKEIEEKEALSADVLNSALSQISTKKAVICISLSGVNVITRYISVPTMSEEEFKKALKFEAQKYIPFRVEEVNLDCCILKKDSGSNKMLVLIAAAKKEFVNQRVKLLEESGFKVDLIDIDSLALINAFNFNCFEEESVKAKTVALLDIGAAFSKLNILEQGTPCLSRDIRIGADNFSNKIATDLNIDAKDADGLKFDTKKDVLEKIKPSLEAVLGQLASEIRKSFDYYESQSVSSVEKIYLNGGGGLLSGLSLSLAHLLGVEINSWDPLKKFKFSQQINQEEIKARSSQLAVAIGLALRQ